MEIAYIICLLLLALCTLLFWRLSRSVPRQTLDDFATRKQQAEIALAKEEQKAILLSSELAELKALYDKARQEQNALERTLEGTNAYLQAQQEKFAEQKDEITTIREQFNRDFRLMANSILEEKSLKFTQLNQQNIGQLLDPLKERIAHFEEKVEKSYNQEAAERNVLKGVIEQLMQQSMQIREEANNLTKALKGDSKKQGNWGEVILERVLERSGLTKGQEYRLQATFSNDQNRRAQPDAIIELPDNKQLIVDSKVSLKAYEQYSNSEADDERAVFLKQHIQSLENHVRELASKNYPDLYGVNSPDFVLLFMPLESALSLAVMNKPELFSDAWDKRVVIVSPSTLLATLRTIAATWKQERQNRNVVEIAKEAGLLYDKFVGFLEDMQQIKNYLSKANSSHDDAMRKLTSGPGNVTRKIENLKVLGAKTSKQIGDGFIEKE